VRDDDYLNARIRASPYQPVGAIMTDHLKELLGGAQRSRTRVRGFAEWRPTEETQQLLAQVEAVLTEYAEYLPLTLRQVFYRLVGAHGFEKTERAYARLGETINRARRARLIDMDAIRDDGGARREPIFYRDAEDFLGTVRTQAQQFQLDRQLGQARRLILMTEAAGMAPQFDWCADDYGIPVLSSGGFDSTTEKHALACDIAAADPTEVLHIGDHDPSGAHLFLAFCEDVEAFVDDMLGGVIFRRLAVTPDQIKRLRLPTAPPKTTDVRAFKGDTAQAEAIAPDVLQQIVRTAIEARIDVEVRDQLLRREAKMRREILKRFK
jgi:hypothetical protein